MHDMVYFPKKFFFEEKVFGPQSVEEIHDTSPAVESGPVRAVQLSRHTWPGGTSMA